MVLVVEKLLLQNNNVFVCKLNMHFVRVCDRPYVTGRAGEFHRQELSSLAEYAPSTRGRTGANRLASPLVNCQKVSGDALSSIVH